MPNWGVQVGGFSMGSSNGNGGNTQAPVPGSSSLMGTNDLQTSIDNLTNKVNDLDSAVNKLSGLLSQAISKPKTSATQHNGPTSWQASPVQSPFTYIKQWATGTLPTYGSSQTGNGGGPSVPQFRPMFGNNAGGTGGGTPNGGGAGGFANGGILGGIGMIGKSLMQYGSSQIPTQVGMSSYVQTATLNMNGGYTAANANLARYAAFGGRGGNLNGLAYSAQDAIAGQQALNYIAGSGAVLPTSSSSYARGALGTAAMFGLGNQGMSYAQSAQLAAQLYSPSMSTKFLQYGFPVTPRIMGGGLRNGAQVAQGLIQGFYGGRSSVNPQTLAFSLREGGNAQVTLQSMFGSQWGDYANMLQAYNTVADKSHLGASQIQTLFNQAARGSTSQMQAAQAQLQKYGLNTSDIQSIKNLQSVKTGRSSDVANSFNSGLQTSVGLLTQFNNILTKIIDIPGINQAVGGLGGFGGGMSSLTNGATMGLGALGGMYAFKGLLSRGATSAAATAAASNATGDAALIAGAGAGGAGFGALGGALLPAAAVGGTLYGLSKIHNKNGTNWLQQGPGGPHSGWNSWSQFGKNMSNWFLSDPGNWLVTDPVSGLKKLFGLMTSGGPSAGSNVASRFLPNSPGGAAGISSAGGSARKTASTSMGGVSGAARTAVTDAEQELGKPYVWGGDSPRVGFDCSGLVMWAYEQAGVRLPRTSQQQWAYLSHGHSVPLNKVQEGDIVFQAGSDGTFDNPGHEALMISHNQIIEAPYTGANIRIRAYNPKEWQHAGRPTGGSAGASVSTSLSSSFSNSNNSTSGNAGLGMASGTYGSSEELDTLTSALLGGGTGGVDTGFTNGSSSSGGGAKGSPPSGGGPNVAGITGGGSIAANKALMQKLAAAYGWGSGAEWAAQNALEMSEAGYNNKIWNTAGSGAYGIAQALPASKYPLAGRPPSMGGRSDPKTQIVWMLDYEKSRYGDPIKAWNFHKAHNYYADGTPGAWPGWAWVGERGPELVRLSGGQQILSNSLSDHVAKQSQKGVQTTPWRANLPNISPASPAAASTTAGTVSLNFHKGSIVITSGLEDSGQVTKSATEFVSKVVKMLQDEELYTKIASGVN